MENLNLRKRGRPKNPNKIKIEEPLWKRTPVHKHQVLAKKYLELINRTVSKSDIKNYLKEISETPDQEFEGAGWDIYKSKLLKYETKEIPSDNIPSDTNI